ncbi:MAG: hypothetical protein HKN76_10385, partial [Saprospiraceae bacterium]|nr:hypothetical protein [Saprospiraceae bacterium]
RYSMRIDGLASLNAGYKGGEMVTKAFTFEGSQLEINYATSAAGFIKIELQDQDGKALPRFTLEDAEEIIGNEIKRIVHWKGSSDVSGLMGRVIRIRIVLKDADLYSFKFN